MAAPPPAAPSETLMSESILRSEMEVMESVPKSAPEVKKRSIDRAAIVVTPARSAATSFFFFFFLATSGVDASAAAVSRSVSMSA